MRDSAERLRRAMEEQGVTDEQLTRVAGLKLRSFINLKQGFAQSLRPQIAIQNFLQTQIWPEIPMTELSIAIPAGSIIALPDPDAGAKFRRAVGTRRNLFAIHDTSGDTLVTILTNTKVVVDLSRQNA